MASKRADPAAGPHLLSASPRSSPSSPGTRPLALTAHQPSLLWAPDGHWPSPATEGLSLPEDSGAHVHA